MAANANSIPAPAIATALAMQADTVVKTKLKTIQNLADILAALMQDVHGGLWNAWADHEPSAAFILIRQQNEKPITKPKCGEAV